MTFFIILLIVAAGLFWWVRYRSARMRREAENREAQVLEALFAARRAAAGGGGETVDLDKVFGGEATVQDATSTDAVLRAAGLEAEVIALVKSPPVSRLPAAAPGTDTATVPAEGVARPPIASANQLDDDDSERGPATAAARAAEEPVPVRDLVQIFYEARGYRVVPAGREARPIELVLRHKTDPLRAYAFAPLAEKVSEATAKSMLERALRIDQSRVLITTERDMEPELAQSLLAQGVRVLDRSAIEAQLAQLDFATAAKILAVAGRRATKRAQAMLG